MKFNEKTHNSWFLHIIAEKSGTIKKGMTNGRTVPIRQSDPEVDVYKGQARKFFLGVTGLPSKWRTLINQETSRRKLDGNEQI